MLRCPQLLVALQQAGKLTCVISQNVDGLHSRSGIERGKLAELHGSCFVEKCGRCQREYVRDFELDTVGSLKRHSLQLISVLCVACSAKRMGGDSRCGDTRLHCIGRRAMRRHLQSGGAGSAITGTLYRPAILHKGAAVVLLKTHIDEKPLLCEQVGFKRTGRLCECGGRLRDNCLDWENALPDEDYERAVAAAEECDLMLCLGSSLRVSYGAFLGSSP